MGKSERRDAPIIALRYMTGFQCLGPACEDTCCGGWKISVDQGHHARLKKTMGRSPDDRRAFASSFELLPPAERTRDHFAVIQLLPDGACPLLEPGGLCSLHHRYGEPALPHTCSSYPRIVNRVGDRLELSGSVSCPEVARRALLSADATDLVPVTREMLGRGAEQQDASTAGEAGYARHLDEVRGTMYGLVSRAEFPIQSRLYFLACLAFSTDALFHPADGRLDQPGLEAALERLARDEALGDMHHRLQQRPGAVGSGAVRVVAEILARRLAGTQRRSFREVVEEVFHDYAGEEDSGVRLGGPSEVDLDLPALARTYVRRREAVLRAFGPRVDLYFHNYCRHFWIKEWYMHSSSLLRHIQSLLLRVAILRFLLLSHPDARAAAAAPPGEGEGLLDRVAVRVFYTFSRAVEHSTGFLEDMSQLLDDRLATLDAAAAVIGV